MHKNKYRSTRNCDSRYFQQRKTSDFSQKLKNPKFEARNSKQIQMTKTQDVKFHPTCESQYTSSCAAKNSRKTQQNDSYFGHLYLGFRNCLEIRILRLGFYPKAWIQAGQVKFCQMIGVILLSVIALSCARLPANIGKSSQVVVIASRIDTAFVIKNLQVYNYVPQKEGLFTFLFAADTAIKTYNKYHMLFLYGSLEEYFINTLLSPDAQDATEKDTFTLFKLDDLWVQGQRAVILAVSESRFIAAGIEKYGTLITKILKEHRYERIKENYYVMGIDNRTKNRLKQFGVVFDLHKGWLIDSTHKKENFIFVHSHFPDRSIFFYKEEWHNELSDSLIMSKRNSLTKKFYNGDYILTDLTTAEAIEQQGMHGMRLKGVWQNDSLVAGGPFLSYFLTTGDTLYVIDGILFLPGERKSEQFTKIEVIMNSFQIINP